MPSIYHVATVLEAIVNIFAENVLKPRQLDSRKIRKNNDHDATCTVKEQDEGAWLSYMVVWFRFVSFMTIMFWFVFVLLSFPFCISSDYPLATVTLSYHICVVFPCPVLTCSVYRPIKLPSSLSLAYWYPVAHVFRSR